VRAIARFATRPEFINAREARGACAACRCRRLREGTGS
jgi:hypothetical protein